MRWGFPPPPNLGTAPVANVRNLKSPYWRGWLNAESRCLVPTTSFCEWTDTRPKVTHWFALDQSRPLFAFAGIWRLWTGGRKGETGEHSLFAFLTTASNDVVRPIQPRPCRCYSRLNRSLIAGFRLRLTMQSPCSGRCRMTCCGSPRRARRAIRCRLMSRGAPRLRPIPNRKRLCWLA
jgi:SOS response associated peptidase (SRAP)